MRQRNRRFSFGLILILLASSLFTPLSASELSDAEQRYSDLRKIHDANVESVNVLLPRSEAEAQQCINRLASSTIQEEIDSREGCRMALSRFQAERISLSRLVEESTAELSALELQIQRLKSASASGSSAGTSSSSSGVAAGANSQITPSQEPNPLSQIAPNPEVSNSVAATPVEAGASNNTTTQVPVAQSSNPRQTPVAPTSVSKVTPSPKPIVKKTISCYKGKLIKKVTAVKPVCPKGYKVKIKK